MISLHKCEINKGIKLWWKCYAFFLFQQGPGSVNQLSNVLYTKLCKSKPKSLTFINHALLSMCQAGLFIVHMIRRWWNIVFDLTSFNI